MPRGRKKTTTPVETPVATAITTDSTSTTPPESEATSADATAVPSVAPLSSPPGAETTAAVAQSTIESPEPSQARGRFRSWVADNGRGYHRLTDEDEHRLVLLFDVKPADDVLTAIKGAGFQYHPDYGGLKQAWVRRNDFEGRLQVEAIEKLIGTTPPRELATR